MNNLQITRMDRELEVTKREMNELEIYGAMLYMYQLVKESDLEICGESCNTIEDIDNRTYYSNKTLEIAEGGFLVHLDNGELVVLDSVFMIEGNNNDLWGYCYYDEHDPKSEEDSDLFLVRI